MHPLVTNDSYVFQATNSVNHIKLLITSKIKNSSTVLYCLIIHMQFTAS